MDRNFNYQSWLQVKLSETITKVTDERPADFTEISLIPAANAPEIAWNMKFHCPEQWKWTVGAPQRWTMKLADGFKSNELKGDVEDGQVRLKFQPPSSLTAVSSIRVKIELNLCAVDSGICTRKSVAVDLNVQPTDQSAPTELSHEFILKV